MLDNTTLNKFINKVDQAYQQFCVWMYANNEFAKHQEEWNQFVAPNLFKTEDFSRDIGCKYKNFWDVTISSLQHSWMLSVRRLLDRAYFNEAKKIQPRLSLWYILELLEDDSLSSSIRLKVENYKPTYESLKTLRDQFLAHNNVNLEKIKVKAGVEDLFKELNDAISDIKRSKSHLQDCNSVDLNYVEALSRCGVDEIFEALTTQKI
jgi:hypothetical protein